MKLAKRRDDIAFWKSELASEVKKMDTEIENLAEHLRVLHKAYQDTKQPLSISQKCLDTREKRQGIDRVNLLYTCILFQFYKVFLSRPGLDL